MFWSLILPLKITAGILLAIAVAAVGTGLVLRWRWWITGMVTVLTPVILALPILWVVHGVVNRDRLGTFTYATVAQVTDFKVVAWLPAGATDLTVQQREEGFAAAGKATQAQVVAFQAHEWSAAGLPNAIPKAEEDEPYVRDFSALGQMPSGTYLRYAGPRAANGAGWDLWWHAGTQRMYLSAAYW